MHQYKQSSRDRVTRGKLTSSEWVVLSMLASGGEGRGGRHSIPLCWPLHYQWRLGLLSTAFVNDAFIKGRAVPCPPTRPQPQRSRDLSSCDFFFLWGYWKSRVYIHKLRTLNDLKAAIRQEIRPIDRLLLARVLDDLKKGLKTASKKTVDILPVPFLTLWRLTTYIHIYIYTGCFTTLGNNCRR